jgi:hypothetical protein
MTVLDLLRGALAAHLRPPTAAAELVGCADRVRASVSGQLACWVVFAAAIGSRGASRLPAPPDRTGIIDPP